MGTTITSYDASLDGPDERLEGRAYIAALSSESEGQAFTSRMDVTDSEISYLGNEGDYHNDLGESQRTKDTRGDEEGHEVGEVSCAGVQCKYVDKCPMRPRATDIRQDSSS